MYILIHARQVPIDEALENLEKVYEFYHVQQEDRIAEGGASAAGAH